MKNSISEIALASPNTLFIHRAVHTIGPILLVIYSLEMISSGMVLPGVLLIAASVMDFVQANTLTKKSVHAPMYFRDVHQVASWMMAILYLLFSLVTAYMLNMPMWIIASTCIVIFLVYLNSVRIKHHHYWASQMTVFITISILVALNGIS